MRVAFIGLGVMGYPMAGYLVKAGHDTVVYNRTVSKAEEWVAEYGGSIATTPWEAAERADIVFSCVGNDDDVREVLLSNDGVLAGIGKGTIIVDHTTASATIERSLRGSGRKISRLPRCAGFGRPGRRRKRPVNRHGWG